MQPNTLKWPFLSLLLWVLYAGFSLYSSHAQAQQTEAALEQQLDQLIGLASYPEDNSKLQVILATLSDDTPAETYARAKGYQALTLAMAQNKKDQALQLADTVLALGSIKQSATAQAELLAVKAEIYLQTNDLTKSQELVPAIEQHLAQVTSPRVLYYGHNVTGRVLQANRQFAPALEHLTAAHQAISQVEDAHTHNRRQFLNLHIARVQLSLQNFKVALELLDKTIEDSKKYGLSERLPELYLNRAYASRELNGLSPEITETFVQAAEFGQQQGNKKVELAGYNNAGAGLLLLKHYDRAEKYLSLARAIARATNNISEGTVIDFNLGYIKVMLKDYDSGLAEMNAAAEQFSTFAPASQIAQIQGLLADAYEVAGRYQQQALALKEQRRLKDEFFQSERDKFFSELQIRYQAQENALQIKLLEQQTTLQQQQLDNRTLSQRLTLLAVVAVLLVAALLLFAYLSGRKLNLLLSKNNEVLQEQSLHDPLTGLLNRRALQHYLPEERRDSSESYALFLLDIDHFKQINDQSGHATGDSILVNVAHKLKALCRADDLVIRWGGEEFLLVLQHNKPDILPELATRILQLIAAEPMQTENQPVRVTLSGGYISLPVQDSGLQTVHWETALKLADQLLYRAKAAGRNQIIGLESLNLEKDQPELTDQQLLQRLEAEQCKTVKVLGPEG